MEIVNSARFVYYYLKASRIIYYNRTSQFIYELRNDERPLLQLFKFRAERHAVIASAHKQLHIFVAKLSDLHNAMPYKYYVDSGRWCQEYLLALNLVV